MTKKNKVENIRAKQIVEMHNIGLSTVWYYVKIGKLKAKKVSCRVTVFDNNEVKKLFGSKNDN